MNWESMIFPWGSIREESLMPMISFVSRSNLRCRWPDYAATNAEGCARNAEAI